jgi:hypothetical protein
MILQRNIVVISYRKTTDSYKYNRFKQLFLLGLMIDDWQMPQCEHPQPKCISGDGRSDGFLGLLGAVARMHISHTETGARENSSSQALRIDRARAAMPIEAAKGQAMRGSRFFLSTLFLTTAAFASKPAAAADVYPTAAVAEYIFVCMKTNGETRDALERCSCSIDVITSIVPYEHFVTAETFKRMGLMNGEKGELFIGSAPAKAAITEMSRAQIEAEVRCF